MTNKKVWALVIFIVVFTLGFSVFLIKWEHREGKDNKNEKRVYKRIVSLSSTTEILCDLGAEDKIVAISGVERDNPYYEILKFKPRCGGDIRNVNVEEVLRFQPDLVFCWKGQADILKKRGLNVYATGTYDVEGVMGLVMDVGRLVGKEKEAERIVADMKKRIRKISEKVEKMKNKPLVYFEAGSLGRTRSVGTLTHDLITRAGGINIAKDEAIPFPILSQEFIIEKDPDIIIVEEYGAAPEEIKKRDGWRNIKAVKNNKVYKSYVYFTNYAPRCIEGLEQYAKWFHPEVFK